MTNYIIIRWPLDNIVDENIFNDYSLVIFLRFLWNNDMRCFKPISSASKRIIDIVSALYQDAIAIVLML